MRPVANRFAVPEIMLDRSRSESLRQQIFSQLAGAIHRGALPDKTRLPSSRLLAKLLGVSRNTVVDAYERLLEDGLVVAKRGSGMQVNHSGCIAVPDFSKFRAVAQAAHYPLRTLRFEDRDGTTLYLNLTR